MKKHDGEPKRDMVLQHECTIFEPASSIKILFGFCHLVDGVGIPLYSMPVVEDHTMFFVLDALGCYVIFGYVNVKT